MRTACTSRRAYEETAVALQQLQGRVQPLSSKERVSVGELATAMLKVKDWPPEAGFRERLPRHYQVCGAYRVTVVGEAVSGVGNWAWLP